MILCDHINHLLFYMSRITRSPPLRLCHRLQGFRGRARGIFVGVELDHILRDARRQSRFDDRACELGREHGRSYTCAYKTSELTAGEHRMQHSTPREMNEWDKFTAMDNVTSFTTLLSMPHPCLPGNNPGPNDMQKSKGR